MQFLHRLLKKNSSSVKIRLIVRSHFRLKVRNIAYYEEAMRHSSVLDGDTSGKNSNERLEFLGDAVLDLSIAAYLYHKDKEAAEGLLTQRKSKVVSRKYLNLLGKQIGLEDLLDVKMRREDIRQNMLGNAMEALIGAVYLDHGYSRTNNSLIKLMKRFGLDEKIYETTDFKSKLHHWAQKELRTLSFKVIREFMQDGENAFEVEVFAEEESLGSGEGSSKKIAEKNAARMGWKKVFDKGVPSY
jgi:ribonuclease III